MNLHHLATLAVLAAAGAASHADTVTAPLDLSLGNASFGRNNAIGSFTDTYTFTLAGSSYLTTATASSAASGTQDLDFTSLQILDAADAVIGTFNGNLGDDLNEFYSLPQMLLNVGAYRLIVTGLNSPTQASYTGNIAITPFLGTVPEPASAGLALAGLGIAAMFTRRRRQG